MRRRRVPEPLFGDTNAMATLTLMLWAGVLAIALILLLTVNLQKAEQERLDREHPVKVHQTATPSP